MKKNIQKILKNSAVIFLVAINIFANVLPAAAISIPSPSSVAAELERRYHLNLGSIQNEGEMFNVSANKQAYPQTLFTFSPADPVEGEKLTVVSTPTYFLGATDTLYFTWYLKRSGCGIENNVSGDKKLKCDEDDDGDVTTNDWKVAAMKEIVRGGWEPNYRDYKDEGVTDGNIDSYYNHVCDPDDNNYVSDKDGYEAAWGGDLIGGGRKDIDNDGDVTGDEAYCYLYDAPSGQTYEIRSGSSSSNQSGATFQTIFGGACANPVCLEMGTESCMENTLESSGPPPVYTQRLVDYSVCKDASATPTCEANAAGDYEAKCSSGSLYCGSTPSYNCSSISNNTCSSVATQGSSVCSNNNSSVGNNVIPNNFCKHLFPKPSSGRTGDGTFDCDREEKFWVSNPEDPDTSDNGKKDEMNATGLGQSEFSWTYAAGDKVGVLIEGNSTTATKHDNSSMKLMWATPVKPCDLTSYTGNMSIYTKKIKGYDVKIPYIKLNNDWDAFWKKCMEDNLVDPRQGGQATKLNVTLSKIPENPVNDPDEKRGDMVTVQSAIDNLLAQGTSTVEYDWSISVGNSISTNAWKKICDSTDGCTKSSTEYLKKEDHTNLKGNDISSLSLKLNISDDKLANLLGSDWNHSIFYLKVRLEARENYSSDDPDSTSKDESATRVGIGDVIIKVLSSNERIGAFIPDIDSDYKIETTGIPICEDNIDPQHTQSEKDIEENFCFITKNQIVGVKLDGEYDNFAWKLDGNPLQCDRSVSTSCDDTKATQYAFFPVTKDIGGVHTVLLTATNTKTGKNVNLVRNFAVVKPYVKIMPDYTDGSEVIRKYLGQYLPLDSSDSENDCEDDVLTKENSCYEYSDKDYEVPLGSDKIKLMEEFHPYWISDAVGDDDAQWTINGLKKLPARTVDFDLPAETKVGDVFVISFDARYKPDNNMRIAMNKIWGIDQFQTTEENLTHTVAVKVAEGTDGIVLNSGYRKFFATIFTNTPGNVAFLVRIMLTAMVLIFLGGLAYTPVSRKVF